jgi:hypothetical protein
LWRLGQTFEKEERRRQDQQILTTPGPELNARIEKIVRKLIADKEKS